MNKKCQPSAIPGLHCRSGQELSVQTRSLSLRLSADGPVSIDIAARSVEVVAATENRVRVMDYERWEAIDEILLMSGAVLPGSRQVPLLDSHARYSTSSVIGSCRGLQVVGSELVGRSVFADDPAVESIWNKVRGGHLTDFSVGYSINESVWVPEGQTYAAGDRSYEGPVRLVTSWTVKELSACPIGADAAAKARAEANFTGDKEKALEPSMARTISEPQKKDVTAMDKELLAFLESRGLPKNATEEEARVFMRGLNDQPSGKTPEKGPDVDATVRAAITDERERFAEISAMGQRFDCTDLAAEMIRSGLTIDQARAKVLDAVAERKAADKDPGFRVTVSGDERDKFRAAGQDSLCMRAGIIVEKPAAGAQDLMGHSLREMARHSLLLANQATGGNVMEMVGRAMTSSDFPALLSNVANKSLLAGYETAPESWSTWCAAGSVSDFKTVDLVAASETEDLDQISESSPYGYGKRGDSKEQMQIATFGKLFAITRQTIINDDLAALTNIPMAHGEAAARKIGDVAYAVLTANAAMRDSVALFHANHGNLGTAAVISESTVAEAIKLMALQKDLLGKRRLNINPQFFIAPQAIRGAAEIFFASNQFSASGVTSTRSNPYAGGRFIQVYDSRLDDSSATGFYFAGPKGKTVTVFFLNGQQAPYMETRQGWSVDGVEYKVRLDCGAKAIDWKALVKNAGA